jgi:hypothetical protein
MIEDCDSGVLNQLPDGCISDRVDACAAGELRNHGQYVSCVTKAIEPLGLSDWEDDAIMSCAGQSDIGKKDK